MNFSELETLFANMVQEVLKGKVIPANIRISYPIKSQPSWKITENVVFIRLFEKEDNYAKLIDAIYVPENETIIKKSARTRVLEVQFIVYGPVADVNVNTIKDGVLGVNIKRLLARNDIFLIPHMPACRRIPELFGERWWNRWDLTLHFNSLHQLADEDVGRIESIEINTKYNS